ncbi:unnamed protein product [Meloidogyne enterolobii]|uniref:Uncharacterized protein n=1 Tax=Meloidogyne enterolobii TaxID=390850 RepID=A0ACB0ZNI1_MELEN
MARGSDMRSLYYAGLVGILDPPRPGCLQSIEIVQSAGVSVKIVTGYGLETAKSIGISIISLSIRLGLYKQNDICLSGPQIDDLKDSELEQLIQNVTIFYKASSRHKLRIVKALQNIGEVVAMTGDGINDAVACKKSDRGAFYSLPTEAKLDVFKCLNHQQLCEINQTNVYFYNFINNFEGELAREEFDEISIGYLKHYDHYSHILLNPEEENFDFPLNEQFEEQFEEKWKNGLEDPIPLYLPNVESNKNIVIHLTEDNGDITQIKLPSIVQNKNQLKIAFYYLNKLFNCSFKESNLKSGEIPTLIFNPELLQLLFKNSIYIETCHLYFTDDNTEYLLQFILKNYLACEDLHCYFKQNKDIMENYKNILCKILTNGGDNFEEIHLNFITKADHKNGALKNVVLFYDYIVEYIATSRDCSKMVANIGLSFVNSTNLELSGRAEKVEIKQIKGTKYTKYQIANIHNPEVRLLFYNEEIATGYLFKSKESMYVDAMIHYRIS